MISNKEDLQFLLIKRQNHVGLMSLSYDKVARIKNRSRMRKEDCLKRAVIKKHRSTITHNKCSFNSDSEFSHENEILATD
ncbi:hypothetical protein A3Q56_08612 [Intoshia linei]|uniref:Uncharacterized protein n=1 Tax=Intoshia linei TaxID=1819745 RepID=A0A177AQJ6_9BILA|nr:hypothetical protein A3Q56_08612 [Intoshia linei]